MSDEIEHHEYQKSEKVLFVSMRPCGRVLLAQFIGGMDDQGVGYLARKAIAEGATEIRTFQAGDQVPVFEWVHNCDDCAGAPAGCVADYRRRPQNDH